MLNLSITACSFYLKKSNLSGNKNAYNINKPIIVTNSSNKKVRFENAFGLFNSFFSSNSDIINDRENQRAFKCTYDVKDSIETDKFIMYPVMVNSGIYGSSSDIIDISTKEVRYKKSVKDVDFRTFYFMLVFPKDNSDVTIQKGMFIFQNIGPYGIKTFMTQKLQQFFSENYKVTLNCSTIAPSLFVKKVLTNKSIKQITMIKNYKSADSTDNYSLGYGQEIKTIAKLSFSEPKWKKIIDSMLYVSGAKDRVFEFNNEKYDRVKAIVEIGDRKRTISINNIENLSIIESIPDDIRTITGNPDKEKLIKYLIEVVNEYLEEMVLNFD